LAIIQARTVIGCWGTFAKAGQVLEHCGNRGSVAISTRFVGVGIGGEQRDTGDMIEEQKRFLNLNVEMTVRIGSASRK